LATQGYLPLFNANAGWLVVVGYARFGSVWFAHGKNFNIFSKIIKVHVFETKRYLF
jgi:hypothetical protein